MRGGRLSLAAAIMGLVLGVGHGAASEERQRLRPDLDAVATGDRSELVKSIAITRSARASRAVVMSLKLPHLADAERIRIAAELTVTNTCIEPGRRCIGRRYRYSPHVGAELRLADRRPAAGRRSTIPLSARRSLKCGQGRPDRNHHCPIVFSAPARPLPAPQRLPCRPDDCRVNFVLDAHHRRAREGNRLVVGADRPDGSVSQDRGRLSAIVFREGFQQQALRNQVDRPRRRRIPMVGGPLGNRQGGHVVTYSARIPNVDRGTLIAAEGSQRLGIGHLPYSAFVSSELIVSSRRRGTSPDPIAKRAATFNGHLTETSGFNCTQGPSAFRTPCMSYKVGIVQLRREPRRDGRAMPLYVNLVSRTFPKRTSARRGDRGKVLPGGGIDVVAYPRLPKGESEPYVTMEANSHGTGAARLP
jgi:hypothetical protein